MKRLGLIIMLMLIVACDPINSPGRVAQTSPQSWIDAPLEGIVLPPNPCAMPGNPCEVISHSSDPLRIVQVELSVNGQVVQTLPNPDQTQTLALTKHQWSPSGPGNFTLRVRAQNSAGVWGGYAQTIITIEGALTQPSPVPPPPFVVPSATLVTKPGVVAPSPLPAATIAFYADATTLVQGQCTMVHWQVTNASQVALDNAAINLNGSKQDCPAQATTHTLRVVTLDNQTVQRTLTINVIAPTRTFTPVPAPRIVPSATPTQVPSCNGTPIIASFSASPNSIALGGSSTLSWGAVTNADSVEIDNGIGGVGAPGSRIVSPSVTTIYVLTARCKSVTAIARTIVTVVPPSSTPARRIFSSPTPTRTPIVPR